MTARTVMPKFPEVTSNCGGDESAEGVSLEHVEEAWWLEVERRAVELDVGETATIPWEAVRARLRRVGR